MCSNRSSHNWLKAHRPKVGICPHQEDYCDTCCHLKTEIQAKQTTTNHLLQSSNAAPEEVKRIQDDKAAIQQTLENHRQEAHKSHTYYTEVSARASEWNEITELEKKSSLSDEEEVLSRIVGV